MLCAYGFIAAIPAVDTDADAASHHIDKTLYQAQTAHRYKKETFFLYDRASSF